MCKTVAFRLERGSSPSFVTFPYTITKLINSELDGLTANNRFPDVAKTNDAFEKTIDEALTGNLVRSASQVRRTFPENCNDSTSPPSPPDPMPASVPLALILPPMIDRVSTNDLPSLRARPAPIPAPQFELDAVISPFDIVRFLTLELPLAPYPVPIPAPSLELLAVIFQFVIVRFQTVELAPV
jgi:hypothetical protein